jgi:hypothetical protein
MWTLWTTFAWTSIFISFGVHLGLPLPHDLMTLKLKFLETAKLFSKATALLYIPSEREVFHLLHTGFSACSCPSLLHQVCSDSLSWVFLHFLHNQWCAASF